MTPNKFLQTSKKLSRMTEARVESDFWRVGFCSDRLTPFKALVYPSTAWFIILLSRVFGRLASDAMATARNESDRGESVGSVFISGRMKSK